MHDLLDAFSGRRVLVIGDVGIDVWVQGSCNGFAPEAASVPLLAMREHSVMPGMAANVAGMIAALGGKPTLAGLIGVQPDSGDLIYALHHTSGLLMAAIHGLDIRPNLVPDPTRCTPATYRFLADAPGRTPALVLRCDAGASEPVTGRPLDLLLQSLELLIPEHEIVLVSDYGKGTMAPEVIELVIRVARKHNILTIVDAPAPSDLESPWRLPEYGGADCLKCAAQDAQLVLDSEGDPEEDAEAILNDFDLGVVVVTRGAAGALCKARGAVTTHIITKRLDVADPTGCGDQVLAVLGLAMADTPRLGAIDGNHRAKLLWEEATALAVRVGTMQAERVVCQPVTLAELQRELAPQHPPQVVHDICAESGAILASDAAGYGGLHVYQPEGTPGETERGHGAPPAPFSGAGKRPGPRRKIVSQPELEDELVIARSLGRTIVFTHGVFDGIHAGHTGCLEECRQEGEILVVAVHSDLSAEERKGHAPRLSCRDRMAALTSLGCVDYVIEMDDYGPHRLLHELRPNVLAQGPATDGIDGLALVNGYGGRVHITPWYGTPLFQEAAGPAHAEGG